MNATDTLSLYALVLVLFFALEISIMIAIFLIASRTGDTARAVKAMAATIIAASPAAGDEATKKMLATLATNANIVFPTPPITQRRV